MQKYAKYTCKFWIKMKMCIIFQEEIALERDVYISTNWKYMGRKCELVRTQMVLEDQLQRYWGLFRFSLILFRILKCQYKYQFLLCYSAFYGIHEMIKMQ